MLTLSQFSQCDRSSKQSPSLRHQDDCWNSPDANQPLKYANCHHLGISRSTSQKEIGTLTNGKTNSALLYVQDYVNQMLMHKLT